MRKDFIEYLLSQPSLWVVDWINFMSFLYEPKQKKIISNVYYNLNNSPITSIYQKILSAADPSLKNLNENKFLTNPTVTT